MRHPLVLIGEGNGLRHPIGGPGEGSLHLKIPGGPVQGDGHVLGVVQPGGAVKGGEGLCVVVGVVV